MEKVGEKMSDSRLDELERAFEKAEEILALAHKGFKYKTIADKLDLEPLKVWQTIWINSDEQKRKLKPILAKLRRLQPPKRKAIHCNACPWADKNASACHWPSCFAQTMGGSIWKR